MEMKQKIFSCSLMLVLSFCSIWAKADCLGCQPLLNKISLQLNDERWATTQMAKVTVSVDAALDKLGLSNINAHVLNNLNKMANTPDWHVVQFVRNQDKSGLEVVHIEAEARLPQNALAPLREKAKDLSKPGETYSLANVDLTPSLGEVEKAHADARSALYNAAKQEIARINQLYPDQHYFLYSIDFAAAPLPPPQPTPMMARVMMVGAAANSGNPPMPVNSKIVETASVVIASVTPGKS